MGIRAFRDLKVWQKSHQITLAIYKITATFPREELFGLTSQMRRASASVPANIAEGCGRNSESDFARFLTIAMGSASELEYHLLLSRDLSLLGEDEYVQLSTDLEEVKRMLTGFIQKLKASDKTTES
ncbi:MAG: four helix bundle protein [Roseiflexaceae bacterium]|nr:four helix bundle protein [Roseiflexaceae bacterium]